MRNYTLVVKQPPSDQSDQPQVLEKNIQQPNLKQALRQVRQELKNLEG